MFVNKRLFELDPCNKFFDRKYILKDCYNDKIHEIKIAIHIHLYYIDMIDSFILYLKDSPIKFDLLVSVSSDSNKEVCIREFNNHKLPNLNKLNVKVVPNKGRDIASFLIDFRDDLKNYDFICHIHSKKSVHTKNIDKWSEYLFDNLISNDAITNILSNFVANEKLGIVFPPVFYSIYEWAVNLNNENKKNMLTLLNKLGIDFEPNEENFVFSAGNMFWVKTSAIEKMFELNLTYEDIPEEPIDNDNTILHAIERIHTIIVENQGYNYATYISHKEFVNAFFERFEYLENIRKLKNKLEHEILLKKNDKFSIKLFNFILIAILYDHYYLTFVLFGVRITIKLREK